MEKKDAETLQVLRARQERQMLELAEVVKYEAWQEAIKSREALEASLDSAYQRYRHYELLLGADGSTLTKPELDDLDLDLMDKASFSSTEPSIATADASINKAESAPDIAAGHQLTPEEADELTRLKHAENWQLAASVAEGAASLSSIIPNFEFDAQPLGIGTGFSFGGGNIAGFFSATAAGLRAAASESSFQAGQSARIASYDRREQDWTLQSNNAAGEVNATLKQLRAAQIREAMARARLHQPPAAGPQRRRHRALPHRLPDRQDHQRGVLPVAASERPGACTDAASSSRTTPRARPNGRCSTSSATPAAPSCATTTGPAWRSCSPGSGSTST